MANYSWQLHLRDGSVHDGPREGGFSAFETADMEALHVYSGGSEFIVELGEGRRPIIVRRVIREMISGEMQPATIPAWGFGWWKPKGRKGKERSICWFVAGKVILTGRDLTSAEVEPRIVAGRQSGSGDAV